MSESEKRLINAIKHYQDSLDRHANSGTSEKLLHAIDKLSRLPIKVCHLEETGVGRTVNALKKVGGTVGENARILVDKWKSMVKGEEEAEQELEKENEADNDEAESPDDEDAGESLQICENETGSDLEKEAEKSEEDTDKHQRTPSKKDSKYKEKESKSKERHKNQSKRSHSSDDSSSSDEETKHKSKSHKSHHKSSKSSRKSSSSDSNSESDSDESNSDRKSASRKSRSRKSSSSSESSESESSEEDSSVERKSKKSSSHHHSDKKHMKRHNSSDSEDSDTKHKSKSSKEKREKSSESKNNKHKSESTSKDRKTPKVKESDNEIKKSSKSEDRTKTKDDKSKRDNHDKKESSRSSSSKSTSSEKEKSKAKNDVENERHKSKVSETSESKKSSSKSDKNHKSEKKRERESSTERSPSKRAKESKDSSSERSKSKDKKEKDNADNKKDKNVKKESGGSTSNNKNNKLKPQQKSAVKSINGIDSESGASFADVLGMLEPSMYKSKKKSNDTLVVQEKVKTKEDKSQKLEKQNKSSTSSSSSSSSVPIPEELSLLKEPNLEPLDINISSLLPSITPNNYRPVSFPIDTQPKKFLSQDEALNHVISAKHQRTKVYSGNKVGCGKVPSLFDMCTRILQDNIDALEYTGGVPYSILKPILEKGTPDQLFQLEFHNPYLIEDSDELWLLHCQKEFRNKKREELESWREMYMRCLDEREAKLKALTANIKQAQDKCIPVRTTKLAYVDSVAKPPRNIARRQAKNGTSIDIRKPSTTPTERLSQLAKSGEAGKMSVPNPGRVAVERSNNHSHSSHLKPKKAPLMAKTLSFLKGTRFGRR
ncbi:transcription elongation factor B polypeptide 3 isoform X1 [Sitophilus oryzae]|uniref:Transcription elongation factor B polypeptide 3 isoform X1 n=1 Tax=Sitophilus oryzae TaxID=7048 RepID=A0A6J2Y1B3_SITOR|nr:transcription elongation factor B polypeptide 3 isoform X1 [Sitophilus oryzae]